MAHAFARRLDRLEAARPDAAGDLRRLVLRAFGSRDRKAMAVVLPRLWKGMGLDVPAPVGQLRLDPAALSRNDPVLRVAMAALPREVKNHMIAEAERQHGTTIKELASRVGIDLDSLGP